MQARKKAWDDQSPNTRKWYAQPHPGKPRDQPDEKYDPEPPQEVHDEFVLVRVCSHSAVPAAGVRHANITVKVSLLCIPCCLSLWKCLW